jgi:glucuronosyltransferase
LFDLAEMKFHDMMNFVYYGIGTSTTEHALQNKQVQDFIQRTDDSFDVIVAEQFYQEAFLMLAHKYKAPVVTVGKKI